MTTLEKAGQEPPAVEPPAVEIEDSQEDDAEDLAEEQEQTDGT
jgi:hypothetical protein